jgi:hypothetical protein
VRRLLTFLFDLLLKETFLKRYKKEEGLRMDEIPDKNNALVITTANTP